MHEKVSTMPGLTAELSITGRHFTFLSSTGPWRQTHRAAVLLADYVDQACLGRCKRNCGHGRVRGPRARPRPRASPNARAKTPSAPGPAPARDRHPEAAGEAEATAGAAGATRAARAGRCAQAAQPAARRGSLSARQPAVWPCAAPRSLRGRSTCSARSFASRSWSSSKMREEDP